MCSVAGYVGGKCCKSEILDSLSRLEYRGYDSAGFACLSDSQLHVSKSIGHLANLANQLKEKFDDFNIGIGHTRWATHGASTQENAHPHLDCKKDIAIVHNGIIENFYQIKTMLLKKGHFFISETDTEVVAHLLEEKLSRLDLKKAIIDILSQIDGAYSLVILKKGFDGLILAKKGSPLCIGIGEAENYVASDPLAFAGKVKEVVFLPDNSFGFVTKNGIEVFDLNGQEVSLERKASQLNWSVLSKLSHESFMLKEIYEQRNSVSDSIEYYKKLEEKSFFSALALTKDNLVNFKKIVFIGCGTSWHAGRIARFFFEDICNLPVAVPLASEFRYSKFFPTDESLYLAISQSGETADTIESIKMIKSSNLKTVVLTNVDNSSLVRECDGSLLMHAGPEVAVASTKAFSCQVASLFWLANKFALQRGQITSQAFKKSESDLLFAAGVMEEVLNTYKVKIETGLALKYSVFHRFIFLGRHISYPFALEAALKLKEISYLFVHAYPAGELKHGPIALIDIHTPVFIFSHLDLMIYKKLVSNAQEVKARGGRIVAFAFEGQEELIALSEDYFVIPQVNPHLGPLAMTGLVQFFVYHMAKILGRSIDKPRNLAKSVTVE